MGHLYEFFQLHSAFRLLIDFESNCIAYKKIKCQQVPVILSSKPSRMCASPARAKVRQDTNMPMTYPPCFPLTHPMFFLAY